MGACKKCGRGLGHDGDTCSRYPHCDPSLKARAHVNTSAQFVQVAKPLDTSQLGPVKIDANADVERAKLVRQALRACAVGVPANIGLHLNRVASLSSDATLAKLGRMLKQ